MWISFFTVVLALALSLGVGAVVLEQNQKTTRRYARRRVARARG
jgi:hypothetical protein